MKLLQEIKERAQQNPQRIVLPEGTEPRTLEAANSVLRDKVAKLILPATPKSPPTRRVPPRGTPRVPTPLL